MLPVGLVIRRKLHDHAASGIFRNQLTSEHFRYNRHQDHGIEQNAADDQHRLPGCEKHGTDHRNNRPDRCARHRPDNCHRQHALAPVVHDAGSARASDRAAKAHQDRANGLPLQPKPRKQTVELIGCPGKEPDLLQISEDEIDAEDKTGHGHTEIQRVREDDAEDRHQPRVDIPSVQKVRNRLIKQLWNHGSESHQRETDEHGHEKAKHYRSEAEKLSEDRAEQPPIPFAQFILPLFGMGHTFEHIPYPLILCFALRLHGLRGVPAFLWLREVPILFRQFRRGSKPVRMREFRR